MRFYAPPSAKDSYGHFSATDGFGLNIELRYGRSFAMAAFDLCTDLRYGRS